MNVTATRDRGLINISLSRRNLEGLLQQLDEAKKGDPAQIMRRITLKDETVILVVVSAQENEEHYNGSDREEAARGRWGVSDGSDHR